MSHSLFATNKTGAPVCAVCDKVVDEIIVYHNDIKHHTVYKVSCHQQKREYIVDDIDMQFVKWQIVGKVFVEEAEVTK